MIPQNQQPVEKVLSPPPGEAHSLDIIKVWKTIQGEGPFAGRPAVFVRLAGCNLQCPWCDTDYTTGRNMVGLYNTVEMVELAAGSYTDLVVLTGGEPFRQDIAPLCYQLWAKGMEVQIETNGTAWQPRFEDIMGAKPTVVCSPKTGFLHPELVPRIDAYKYVVQAGFVDEKDGLPTSALGNTSPPARPKGAKFNRIYIQPLDQGDEKLNADNMKAAVESCLTFGYTLCLQMHKYAGLE